MPETPVLRRVELWSGLEAESGAPKALTPGSVLGEISEITRHEEVNGEHWLRMTMPLTSPSWQSGGITEGDVLRVIMVEDGSEVVEEYRITKVFRARSDGGSMVGQIEADAPLMELRGRGLVTRTEATGLVQPDFTVLGLTPTELINQYVLPAAPSYWALGTVDATAELAQFPFDFDTPLAVLRRLAELTGTELYVTRPSGGAYQVHLLSQVGASSEETLVHLGTNLRSISKDTDSSSQANVIYGKGGGPVGSRLTLGQNAWQIASVTNVGGTVHEIVLEGDPVWEDDCLNGLYIGGLDRTNLLEITDSEAPGTVTVATAPAYVAGQRMRFYADSAAADVAALEDAGSIATYRRIPGQVVAQDLVPSDNMVATPKLDAFTGGVPDDWSEVGTPTASENTDQAYTIVGLRSARVVADAAEEGLISDAVTITPTEEKPYFSALVSVFVVSGAVRLELVSSVDGTLPPQEAKAWTRVHDQFVDLSINGLMLEAADVQLRVVADGGPAEFYLDAALLNNEADAGSFVSGSAANELWRRTALDLLDRRYPKTSYEVVPIDVSGIDSVAHPHKRFTIGGYARVIDEDLADDVLLRVVTLETDVKRGIHTRTELSSHPVRISGSRLDPHNRKERGDVRPPAPSFLFANAAQDSRGYVVLKYALNPQSARSVRYLVSSSAQPTRADVIATGAVIDEVSAEEVLDDVGAYTETTYVSVVAMSGAAGAGEAGAFLEFVVKQESKDTFTVVPVAIEAASSVNYFEFDLHYDVDFTRWTHIQVSIVDAAGFFYGETFALSGSGRGVHRVTTLSTVTGTVHVAGTPVAGDPVTSVGRQMWTTIANPRDSGRWGVKAETTSGDGVLSTIVAGTNIVLDVNGDGHLSIRSTASGGSSTLADLDDTTIASLADDHALMYDSGAGVWVNRDLVTGDIKSGTFGVNRGGTGRSSVTSGNLVVGAGTGAMTLLAPGAAGGYVRSNGSTWVRNSGVPAGDVNPGTFGAGSFKMLGNMTTEGTEPQYYWYETDAGFNEKRWRIVASNGILYFQGREDSGEAFANPLFMRFLRSGVTANAVEFGADVYPDATNALSNGTSFRRWSGVFSVDGDFSGDVTIGDDLTFSGSHPIVTMSATTDSTFFTWGGGGLRKITDQGGVALYADSSVFVHAGDSVVTHVAAAGIVPATTTENLFLSADNEVIIYADMQGGYAGREEWVFQTDGDLQFPTGRITGSGIMVDFQWQGTTISGAYGGTGRASLLNNAVLVGGGSLVNFIAPGTAGQVLRSAGSSWASANLQASDLPGHTHAATQVVAGAFASSVYTFPGSLRIDNTSGGAQGLWVRRSASDGEALKLSISDGWVEYDYHNAESVSRHRFRIDNTDTESGGGAAANNSYIDFMADTAGIRIQTSSNGTVGAPTYSWVGDPVTGIYLVTTSSLGFSVAGTQRGRFTTGGLVVTGTIDASGNVRSSVSDQRLKTDIVPIGNALDRISRMVGVTHGYTSDALALNPALGSRRRAGVLYQDVVRALPEAGDLAPFDDDGRGRSISGQWYGTVDYDALVPLLVEGIKALRAEVDELRQGAAA